MENNYLGIFYIEILCFLANFLNANFFLPAVKDIIDDKTLVWNSAIILHDDSISMDVLSTLTSVLNENIAVVSYNLGSDPYELVKDIFINLPIQELGNKFILVTKHSSMLLIHKQVCKVFVWHTFFANLIIEEFYQFGFNIFPGREIWTFNN